MLGALFTLLLLLPGTGAATGREPVPVPDREGAGSHLAELMLAELDARALPLTPGPLGLRRDPAAAGLVEGLARVLARRGFTLAGAGSALPAGRPRLALAALPGAGYQLSSPDLGAGPWRVVVDHKPWVRAPAPPAGRIRCLGDWELTRAEALAASRARLAGEMGRHLAAALPWRPWRRPLLAAAAAEAAAASDHFLELARTGTGDLWRAWLLAPPTAERIAACRAELRRRDGSWFLRLGSLLLAALLAWGLANRLDWWTRGYFTTRIRVLLLLAWLGLCGILGAVP